VNIKLYHIVHIDNLHSIIADGFLYSDSVMENRNAVKIGMTKIKNRRLKQIPSMTPGSFNVFQQDVIIRRLGGADSYRKECKESSCIVDLGRKASVDYVAQCQFGKLGSNLAVTFELYNVSTSGLIAKFSETAKNIDGLLAVMKKKIPDSFRKIPGASPVGGETGGSQSGTKKDAEAYYKSGNEYYDKGDYDNAISEFTEAIRLKPKFAEAYSGRGRAYNKKEDYDIAMSDFNEAIRLNPKLAEAYSSRCGVSYIKGGSDRAISDCNQAIRLNPKFAEAYVNRGFFVYQVKGDYDRAIKDYTEAIKLNPNYADAYNHRCMAYSGKGDYDRAIKDCTEAIRLNPKVADAYMGRGYIYDRKGYYNWAIKDYTEAIRLDPNTYAYQIRGFAHEMNGDVNRAIADYKSALQIDPGNFFAKDRLERILKRRSR